MTLVEKQCAFLYAKVLQNYIILAEHSTYVRLQDKITNLIIVLLLCSLI